MDARYEFDAPKFYDFTAMLATESSPGTADDNWFATQGPSGKAGTLTKLRDLSDRSNVAQLRGKQLSLAIDCLADPAGTSRPAAQVLPLHRLRWLTWTQQLAVWQQNSVQRPKDTIKRSTCR